jgi:hypothetical protein
VTPTAAPSATPSPSAAPTRPTLTGTLAVIGRSDTRGGCETQGGYSDIGPGVEVVVKVEAGKIMGTATLGAGELVVAATNQCRFGWSIPSIPDAQFYAVEIGRRAGLTFSKAQLEADGWTVERSLGE